MDKFDLIFRGDIVLGHSLADVKLRLQQLFKADAAKIEALFSGRPVAIKRNLDRATGEKYCQILQKAGAQVSLSPSGETRTGPSPAAGPPAATPASAPVPRAKGLSLAPVGGYLVRPGELPRLTPVSVDVSNLSLRPAEGNLLDAGERAAVQAISLEVPDLDLAELGADLLNPEDRQELPLMAVEPEDWGLAEPGSDLLTPSERPKVEPVVPRNTDFDLAPPGSDMGQKKTEVDVKVPDTSGIRLANQD